MKSFNIKDGLGIKLLQRYGIDIAIITGRRSSAVERRAAELGIETLVQGREDKGVALRELLDSRQLAAASGAYMGDDLPDLAALRLAGLSACPSDAATKVLESVDWVAPHSGGHGAVRALADFILRLKILADLYPPEPMFWALVGMLVLVGTVIWQYMTPASVDTSAATLTDHPVVASYVVNGTRTHFSADGNAADVLKIDCSDPMATH